MNIRRWWQTPVMVGALCGLALTSGCASPRVADGAASSQSGATTTVTPALPRDTNILFWTQDQRDLAFRTMERLVPARTVAAGQQTRALPMGRPLAALAGQDGRAFDLESYIGDQRLAGIIILHRGQVRLERYMLGFGPQDRWTSFSVAKSFTSTLVGAAIADGHIGSLTDPVTRYIPELAGSGYDGVTIAQLMAMQSGVRWNESYTDPNSDVARFNAQLPEGGLDPVTAYMRQLPRAHAPGTHWNYNTGETNLIGVLVERAVGKNVSEYLSEKIWRPYGMEADAAWLLNAGGREISGCCLSMRLRDYARFGQFVLDDGVAHGRRIVPAGWFAAAGHKQADIGRPGFGYGYQWWTQDSGAFAAQGIFGQGIFIDPARQLVIAGVGNWPAATGASYGAQRQAFYQAVQAAIDREAGAATP